MEEASKPDSEAAASDCQAILSAACFQELWWLGTIILKSLISPKEAIFHREKCLWPTAFLAYASMDVMWNSLASNPVARCHIWHCLWIEDNDAKQILSALKLTGCQFFSEPLEKAPIHKVRKIRCPFLFKAKSGFQRFKLLFCHQPPQKYDRANSNPGGNKLWKNLIEFLFAVEFFSSLYNAARQFKQWSLSRPEFEGILFPL